MGGADRAGCDRDGGVLLRHCFYRVCLFFQPRIHQGGNGTVQLAFHGGESGQPTLKPYTFDDIVTTLNSVAAYDWRSFLVSRVQDITPRAPLGGIEGGGWKLSYSETPTSIQKAADAVASMADARYSIGAMVGKSGMAIDVIPDSPAAKAGLGPGMMITTVNGQPYTNAGLLEAIRRAKGGTTPIQLGAMESGVKFTFSVDYHGGERYPYLERDNSKPDVLTSIITPSAKK